jgi:hypothetical protein
VPLRPDAHGSSLLGRGVPVGTHCWPRSHAGPATPIPQLRGSRGRPAGRPPGR